MGWEEGAGFRIIGTIKKIFINDRGNFAAVKVKVAAVHSPEFDLKVFDKILIGDIKRDLRQGQRVQFTGGIENEKATERNGDEIKNEAGYTIWMPALRLKKYEVEGSSRAPQSKSENRKSEREPGADDGDPMGGAGGDPMGGGRDPFGG